ncbi:MAG: PHP domain-containing protein [Gemmatimonadaceae bacterium]
MSVDPRSAAHVLARIAAYLELQGENRFKARAYETASRALRGLPSDDLAGALERGELAAVRGLGPATLAVVRDLVEHGESRYLEQLGQTTPEGLLDMLDVPGLTPPKIHAIHEALGIETLDELEDAARDGRLAALPRYGKKTADRILHGIALRRARGQQRLYYQALAEGERLRAMVEAHPDVVRAAIAGPLRRHCETVGNLDVVAACRRAPAEVAASFTRIGGVKSVSGAGSSVEILFVDGITLRLHCTLERDYGLALLAATGVTEHVGSVVTRLIDRGYDLGGGGLEKGGMPMPTPDEAAVYSLADLQFVDPALRENHGELAAAALRSLPSLVTDTDLRGVLHCHTVYSDGRATVAEMAQGALARGWSYIGISDHSQAAFYAGGLSEEQLATQIGEIDELNATGPGIRILKGIEADILADGRLDYSPELLDRLDYVIGSIHARYSMDGPAMTKRVLRALDEPHLTILAHPTGRLLLSREPYGLDVEAMLEKAAALGVAVELNADPHRLDLDWRYLLRARELGVTVAIGPDAHSVNQLDYVFGGVGMARKGWLEPKHILNTRDVNAVLAFARARRSA